MTLRVLMFGSTGQVASEIRRRAGADVVLDIMTREDADLGEPDACAEQIAKTRADVVLNAAAFTAVDEAETCEALAMRINGDAPAAMARAAAARGIPFLHISTDYVFDGTGSRPWREDDPPKPISVYGCSKLLGERGVRCAGGPHAILRTAWVHSAYGRNFVRSMLALASERRALQIVDDQFGGPTPASQVAEALLTIARRFADGSGVSGVFHFAGVPVVSWHDFALEIFGCARSVQRPEITSISSADRKSPARRPKNSVLDCNKIANVYGIYQPDWRIFLPNIINEFEAAGL